MIADSSNAYFLQADGDQLHVDSGSYTVVGGLPAIDTQDPPRVVPKQIVFQAKKDGYKQSALVTDNVIVLGDRLTGAASQTLAIPNINYGVLHDPPGDGSYAYFDETLTTTGVIRGMNLRLADGARVPVYPSPWSQERTIDGVNFEDDQERRLTENAIPDLEDRGLIGRRNLGSDNTAGAAFAIAATVESATGAAIVATGSLGYALQIVKVATVLGGISVADRGAIVQYEVSPSRRVETPSGDELPDLLGPGRGDTYWGEGWTLGLQTKHRLGIRLEGDQWVPETETVATFDVLARTNQYVYTIPDIVNIIANLETNIAQETNPGDRAQIQSGLDTWKSLLDKNIAYQWVENLKSEQLSFEEFRQTYGLPDDDSGEVETLIFSAGPAFEYSRGIAQSNLTSFSTSVSLGTSSSYSNTLETSVGSVIFGTGSKFELAFGSEASIGTGQEFGKSVESGDEVEQTVGFVLQDDDVGDNITTRVFRDPVWGTPLFLSDPTSITSDPWEPGTNKAVDIRLERIPTQLAFRFAFDHVPQDISDLDGNIISGTLNTAFSANGTTLSSPSVEVEVSSERWIIRDGSDVFPIRLETDINGDQKLNVYQETVSEGPFDYHAGAHYRFKLVYTGVRDLESDFTTVDFVTYAPQTDNDDNMRVRFNGNNGPYPFGVTKEGPVANFVVSVYPPEVDQNNSYDKEYSVMIFAQQDTDAQINSFVVLKPRFADLKPPVAEVVAPYHGEPISPAMFGDDVNSATPELNDDAFTIQVISEDTDIDNIRIESRSKAQNGVWGNWSLLGGLTWTEGQDAPPTNLGGNPSRNRYNFKWTGTDIDTLGVGEYQVRALATDKAGNPTVTDRNLPTAPTVTFVVDANKPTVLTTIPDYQAKSEERIYKGELSVLFTDDMREHDFTPDTFEVINLLEQDELLRKVSGFVSYSPAERKAIFVPEVSFAPNSFYKVTIRTENDELGVDGVRDLAGNPLDQDFSWTFRTTDSLFEEVWSVTMAAAIIDDNGTPEDDTDDTILQRDPDRIRTRYSSGRRSCRTPLDGER
jgi:hypothetical protein